MRHTLALALAALLEAAGCFSGLDEGPLTRAHGSGGDGGNGGSCDDFSNDALGGAAAGWTEIAGTWRVVMAAGQRSLGQVANQGGGNFYLATTGSTSLADLSFEATALDGADNPYGCLVARYTAPDSYDAFCVDALKDWTLTSVTGGNARQLAGGSIDTAQVHRMAIDLSGASITVSLDGSSLRTVSDPAHTVGAVGVATRHDSAFAHVCLTPR